MSAPRNQPRSLQDLLNELHGLPAESPGGIENRVRIAILVRLIEQQEATAHALVDGLRGLVSVTSRLVYATWGLVIVMLVLAVGAIAFRVLGK